MATTNHRLTVDYSPTAKHHCQGCHRVISAGELRAGTSTTDKWKHIDCLTCSDIGLQLSRCFTALVYQQKPNLIESFVPLSHLSTSDQQTARNILFALAMSGWQHYRQSQQASSATSSCASPESAEQALLRKLAMNAPTPQCTKEQPMRFSSPPRYPAHHAQRSNTTPTNRRSHDMQLQPNTATPQRLHGMKRRPSFDSPADAANKRRR